MQRDQLLPITMLDQLAKRLWQPLGVGAGLMFGNTSSVTRAMHSACCEERIFLSTMVEQHPIPSPICRQIIRVSNVPGLKNVTKMHTPSLSKATKKAQPRVTVHTPEYLNVLPS